MSDLSTTGARFGFLEQNTATELKTLAANYLSLGQFELARSTLAILATIDQESAVSFLQTIITEGPPSTWHNSVTVPSPSHLVWLALIEFKKYDASNRVTNLGEIQKRAEFGIVLHQVISTHKAGHEQEQEEIQEYYNAIHLYHARQAQTTSSASQELHHSGGISEKVAISLPARALSFLRQSFALDFALTCELARSLVSYAPLYVDTTKTLLMMQVEAIGLMLDRGGDDAREQACSMLQYLSFPKETIADGVDMLFERFVRLYVSPPEEGHFDGTRWQQLVYSALVAGQKEDQVNYAMNHYMKIERALTKADAESSTLPRPFAFVDSIDPARPETSRKFWSEYHTFISVTKKHFLEYIILKALEFISSRQWNNAETLLKPFGKLKPTLLLMTWDKFQTDIAARERLLSLLWNDERARPEHEDEQIVSKARLLAYETKMIRWCSSALSRFSSGATKVQVGDVTVLNDEASLPNFVAELARNHSLLYIMHSHLHRIDAADILRVVSESPDTSEAGRADTARDIALIHSYFALRSLMMLINDIAFDKDTPQVIETALEQLRVHILGLDNNRIRIQLIETAFSTIFLRASAWKNNEFGFMLLAQQQQGEESIQDANPGDYFVCGPSVVVPLIQLLRECIDVVNDQEPTELSVLTTKLNEAQWRANFITSNSYFEAAMAPKDGNPAKTKFMNLMVASPSSLLFRCVREQDFASARQVLEFFGLQESPEKELVELAEASNLVRHRFASAKSPNSLDWPVVKTSERVFMALDMAISIAQTKQACSDLIEQAKKMLEGDNTATDPQYLTHFKRFELMLSHGTLLGSLSDESPLRERSIQVEPLPSSIPALEAYFQMKQALKNVCKKLTETLTTLEQNAASVDTEGLLMRVTADLEKHFPSNSADTDAARSATTRPSEPYLHHFLDQLYKIGTTVRDDPVVGRKNFFELLTKSPKQILAQLVFESKNYKKAETLAQTLDIDLIPVILDSVGFGVAAIHPPPTFPLSESPADRIHSLSALEPTAPLSSFHPSSFGLKDFEGPSYHPISTGSHKYSLSLEVLDYLRKSSPTLAVMAAVLRSTPEKFDSSLIDYALTTSKKSFPALYNWLSIKSRSLALFYSVQLRRSHSSVPFQLHPSVPASHAALYQPPSAKFERSLAIGVLGDKDDPLNTGNDILFEPLYGNSGRQTAPQSQQTRAGRSSLRGRSADEQASSFSRFGTPGNIQLSDDESDENDDDEGDVDLAGTPRSVSPSSLGSFRSRFTDSIDLSRSVIRSITTTNLQNMSSDSRGGSFTTAQGSQPNQPSMSVSFGSAKSSGLIRTRSSNDIAATTMGHQFLSSLVPPTANLPTSEQPSVPPADQVDFQTLLQSDDMDSELQYYEKVVGQLIDSGHIDAARTLADAALPGGCPDDLLEKLVEASADKATVWAHIIRIRNNNRAASLVLKNIEHWDIDVATDMTYMSYCHVKKNAIDSQDLQVAIVSAYRRLGLYRELVDKTHSVWRNWQALHAACVKDLPTVVRQLLNKDLYNQARELAELFGNSPLKLIVEEKYILHLLSDKSDSRAARARLSSLDPDEAVRAAEALLDQVKNNTERLFVIQFLMDMKAKQPAAASLALDLSTKELGVKILLRLPPDLQALFQNFINQPEAIVESLLMSEQTSVLQSIFNEIPQVRDDTMVLHYAVKALDTTRLLSSSAALDHAQETASRAASMGNLSRKPSLSSLPQVPQKTEAGQPVHILSSEDPSGQNLDILREEHKYASAPNHQLATAILDLCSSPRLATLKCIEMSDNFSQRLSSFRDRLEIVRIIQQLLYYAKLRLTKELDSDIIEEEPHTPPASPRPTVSPVVGSGASFTSLITLCDTLLSRIDLMLQLIFAASDIMQNLSLSGFADPQKIRIIRDKLIDQDRLDLALVVASKCGIESDPVYAAKGLQLLQAMRYQEAKQVLKYCLVPARGEEEAPPQNRSSMITQVQPRTVADNATLLHSILRVLESAAPPDASDLKKKHAELLAKVQSNSGPTKRLMQYNESGMSAYDSLRTLTSIKKISQPSKGRTSTLDFLRYMQCIYYLQQYGTVEDLIQFWLRHNLLEDAVRHVLANQLDSKLFLDVVLHALSRNMLSKLKDILGKLESNSKVVHEYLLAVCKHFAANNMLKLLLEFQVLMKDYVRAGLTCVKIFNRTTDFTMRLNYLNAAKSYFQKVLQLTAVTDMLGIDSPEVPAANSNLAVANRNDMSKYVKTSNLQIKVTTFFQQLGKNVQEPMPLGLNLFQNSQRKARACLEVSPREYSIDKIAELLVVNFNFDLGFQVIQEYRLPTNKIYHDAMVKMANAKQTKKIDELMKSVKPWLSDAEWDTCVLAAVQIYANVHDDVSAADNFASKLRSELAKTEGLILSRKLKQAYLAAVKLNSVPLVQKIKDEARKLDMRREYELCEKFLQTRQH